MGKMSSYTFVHLVLKDNMILWGVTGGVVPCIWNTRDCDTSKDGVSRRGRGVSCFLDELEVAELIDEGCNGANVLFLDAKGERGNGQGILRGHGST